MSVNFVRHNLRPFRLRKPLRRNQLTIVGNRLAHEWLQQGKYDEHFPATKGFVYMWLPGYNPDKTEALVYAFHTGSDTYAHLDMWEVLLKLAKRDGKWAVVSSKELWRT
jgi:hypothetical protein